MLFPNTIKKQEQWVCIYKAKNKIFSKNYNIKKKKKETENEKEKGTDRREKRRVWGQRVWERRVEAVCGTGGTVRTTLMNSLRRRRLMSAWYYRYYSHCCCYSDSLPLPLHWCFFCFCFALYFFKNQKNNQKKKEVISLFWDFGSRTKFKGLFVCLFSGFWILFLIQRATERRERDFLGIWYVRLFLFCFAVSFWKLWSWATDR